MFIIDKFVYQSDIIRKIADTSLVVIKQKADYTLICISNWLTQYLLPRIQIIIESTVNCFLYPGTNS